MIRDGFIRVAASTPEVKVADVEYNREQVCEQIEEGRKKGASMMVFPELVLTGYTCGELFIQKSLLAKAKEELRKLIAFTAGDSMLVFVGLPWEYNNKLYNVAAAIQDGKLLGLVPKRWIPNYSEFYEGRYFNSGWEKTIDVSWDGYQVPMGMKLLFSCDNVENLVVGAEICEDVWVLNPPSIAHASAGATVIVNCSASDEVTGKSEYRRSLISGQSARLLCAYIYANAGEGESSQDLVFGGHNIIAENGSILAESKLFENGITISEIDFKKLAFERRKISTYPASAEWDYSSKDSGFLDMENISRERFSLEIGETALTRKFAKTPFIPSNQAERNERCHLILQMQSHGLMKRIAHTHSKTVVIGISGGLDSTLALLVCVMAMDLLKRPHTDIVAVTMPCFGTTKRTRSNAEILCDALGVTFREVDISNAVLQHFEDIGHDYNDHSVVFENGQARERTKVLMNIANQVSGMVVGTGDLSELALGWATYNGDHMSMYGVNASIPKTLVRHIVQYYGDTCTSDTLRDVLYDILDTPVSPELLPTDESGTEMTQKTEDLVGPYELHDFFLYYGIRWGFEPSKVKRLAKYAFEGDYPDEVIDKWLKTFYRRFFSQQFKRSCLPDGAKIGSVTLSPRGDWRMPSDAVAKLWLDDIDK